MQRRGAELSGRLLPALLISLLGIGALILLGALLVVATRESSEPLELATVSAAPRADDQTGEPATDVPPNTVTDFYPESSNLSDCVGLVERPGCGSDARGGWRQLAVFAVLFAGLGVIFWRVSRGIRANRAALDAAVDPHVDHT